MLRRNLFAAALGAASLAAPRSAGAQSWPAKPVRMFIPWPPGQATDIVGRFMAERLAAELGQPLGVESRPGRGGIVGTDAVAKSPADGYSLLAASSGPLTIAPLVQRTPYDPEADFTPIAMVGVSPYLLVVGPSFAKGGIKEFIATVKANPGKHTYSSSGAGATAHILTEWFNKGLGLDADHVPFQGSAAALAAVASGKVDYAIDTVAATGPMVADGKIRALGVSLAKGSVLAAGVPSIAEAAPLPGYDAGAWTGLFAPAGTPPAVVQRLAAAVEKFMATPAAREQLSSIGLEPSVRTGESFVTHLREQKASFEKAVRTANIKAE